MAPVTRYVVRRIVATKGSRHRAAKAWQAMRILRHFTADDLLAVCEFEKRQRQSLLTFLGYLRRAGYLRAHYGNPGRHEVTRYTLIRNSGPFPPAIVRNRTSVWDWNTETEYPLTGEPNA